MKQETKELLLSMDAFELNEWMKVNLKDKQTKIVDLTMAGKIWKWWGGEKLKRKDDDVLQLFGGEYID